MIKAKTVATVRERERELQFNKIGFCCDTQKYIVRYRRQKLYVYA